MNKPTHILYLHNKSEISGGEQSLLNLWENLDGKIYKPFLMIPQDGDFSSKAREAQVDCLYYQMPKLSLSNCVKIFKAIRFLQGTIKQKQISLIHSYAPRNNVIGAIAAKLTGIPIIWHERNMIFGSEKDISKTFSFLPNALICNSFAVAKRFKQTTKIHVIHNGVNCDVFNPVASTTPYKESKGIYQKFIVGLIGNLNERKRPEFCFKIAQHFKDKELKPIFMIVGEGFSREGAGATEKLKKMAKDAGIDDMITFSGFSADIAETLNTIDVIIHTTLKEACSRVILESMAAGKPVLAINDGGNPELITNQSTGFLIEADDHNRFAEIIEHLMHCVEERNLIGGAARLRVEEQFSITQNTQTTCDLYSQLLKGKS